MSRFLPLPFIRAVVVVALSGCMSWRSEPLSPAHLIATRKPPVVRVTRADSSKVILSTQRQSRRSNRNPAGRYPQHGHPSIRCHGKQAADALGCGPDEAFLEAASGAR